MVAVCPRDYVLGLDQSLHEELVKEELPVEVIGGYQTRGAPLMTM
jgi:hypothetical protein